MHSFKTLQSAKTYFKAVHNLLHHHYQNRRLTGGYAIPHFRNFSAVFPQIRTQKLTISLFDRHVSKVFLLHIKTQHDQPKPSNFYFACANYMQAALLSSWVFFLRENFILVVVVVAIVFRSSICIVFICFSAFKSLLHNIFTDLAENQKWLIIGYLTWKW